MSNKLIEQTARAAIEHVFPGAIAVGEFERFNGFSERFEIKFNYIRAELWYDARLYGPHKWMAQVWVYCDGPTEYYGRKTGYARSALRQAYAAAYSQLSKSLIEQEKRVGRLRIVLECLQPPEDNQKSS